MSASFIDAGTIARSVGREQVAREDDPRTRRFGINPAILQFEVHPRFSARQEALIPHGRILRFDTLDGMSEQNWSVDPMDRSDYVTTRTLSAKEAIENVKRAAWQQSRDMGFRELSALTALEDDEARAVIAAVFPDDMTIFGIECPYRDYQDRCLSCRMEWLLSDECETRAEATASARAARIQLIEAYQTAQRFLEGLWGGWLGELQRRERGENGISVLEEPHLFVMRQLHQRHPSEMAAEAIRSTQEAQAAATREGLREIVQEIRGAAAPAAPPALDMEAIREQFKLELALEREEMRKALLADLRKEQAETKQTGKGK